MRLSPVSIIIHVSAPADKQMKNQPIDAGKRIEYNKCSEQKGGLPVNKKLILTACILWLAGLAAFIAGLNIKNTTGQWLTVIGQIAFLIGLALQGVLYYKKQKEAPKEEKPEDQNTPDPNV